MKHLLIIIATLFVTSPAYCQTKKVQNLLSSIEGKWQLGEYQNVTFSTVLEFPDLNASEIYTRAKIFFAYYYNDSKSATQVDDKEGGVLIVQGTYGKVYETLSISLATVTVSARHLLRIEIDDNKAKLTISLQYYDIDRQQVGYPATHESFKISSRYPIAERDLEKNLMSISFYNAYQYGLITFEKLAAALNKD